MKGDEIVEIEIPAGVEEGMVVNVGGKETPDHTMASTATSKC